MVSMNGFECWIDWCIDEWMDGWMNGWMVVYEWKDGLNGWMDVWNNERMDLWMDLNDGWRDELLYLWIEEGINVNNV